MTSEKSSTILTSQTLDQNRKEKQEAKSKKNATESRSGVSDTDVTMAPTPKGINKERCFFLSMKLQKNRRIIREPLFYTRNYISKTELYNFKKIRYNFIKLCWSSLQ